MKKRTLLLGIVVTLFMGSTSCTDAKRAKLGGYGGKFKVEMINCDGTVARTWLVAVRYWVKLIAMVITLTILKRAN
mgnify:CR=1 FL=1